MIKEKRKKLGFTQEQIASKLNISLRQYVRIDNEEDLPRRDILNKLIPIIADEHADPEFGTGVVKTTPNGTNLVFTRVREGIKNIISRFLILNREVNVIC